MPITLFISYKREDKDFAKELKRRIDTAGIGVTCWYDDASIPLGADWTKAIDDEILSCTGMLVVVTVEALRSQYVTYEWSYAMGANRPVIPIVLEIPDPKIDEIAIHPKLNLSQGVIWTDPKARNWPDLIQKLAEFARQEHIPKEIKDAEERLFDTNPGVVDEAIEFLITHSNPHAKEALLRAAQGDALETSRRSALALADKDNSQDPRIISGLAKYLDTDMSYEQDIALQCLVRMNTVEAMDAIWQEYTQIVKPHRRLLLIGALATFTIPEAVPKLVEVLHTADLGSAHVFEKALIEALGRHGDPQAISALVEFIERQPLDNNTESKIDAVKAIANIGDPSGIAPLVEIFKIHIKVYNGDVHYLFQAVIHAIGDIGGEAAIDGLQKLFNERGGEYLRTINSEITTIQARMSASK